MLLAAFVARKDEARKPEDAVDSIDDKAIVLNSPPQ